MGNVSKVVINHAGMDDLLSDPAIVAALTGAAQTAATRARGTAPVKSGRYREGIRVRVTNAAALGMHFRTSNGRPAVVVEATAPYSMVVEARTGNLARSL